MSGKDLGDAGDAIVEKKKRRVVKVDKLASPSVSAEAVSVKPEGKASSKSNGGAEDSKSAIAASNRAMFFYEEMEVANRDPRKDLEIHKAVCNELRNEMATIHRAKQSGGGVPSPANQPIVDEAAVHGTLQFVSLKKLNRVAHFRAKKMRDVTADAKQRVDAQHLRLQNLLYEVAHLQKEVARCLQFRSGDDDVRLVDIERFYAEAPPEISRPETTRRDPHAQTLARLDWELKQRVGLAERLAECEKRRDEVAKEIDARRKHLESLRPKLDAALAATRPVQEYLEMPLDEVREQHRVAASLPPPLYVLYVQASAYAAACDKRLKVTVQGDASDLARTTDDSSPDHNDDSDTSGDADDTNGGKSKAKRHRRSVGGDTRVTRRRDRLLRRHALSVALEVQCGGGTVLHLVFFYVVAMEIVTVEVRLRLGPDVAAIESVLAGDLLLADTLLCRLYAADTGSDTPHPANRFALRSADIADFAACIATIGRPYVWAQELCGLCFLPASIDEPQGAPGGRPKCPQASLSANRVEDVIKRLRRRVKVRLLLRALLARLEQGSVAVRRRDAAMPPKITARLSKWRRVTYTDFMATPHVRAVVDLGFADETDVYFSGEVERGSANLGFLVVVSADYPRDSPLFALRLRWNGERTAANDEAIRAMETEVNVFCPAENTENGGALEDVEILACQVERLLVCFDIYLETEGVGKAAATEGPAEMGRERVYTRLARGRDRARPYMYNGALGFFSHR